MKWKSCHRALQSNPAFTICERHSSPKAAQSSELVQQQTRKNQKKEKNPDCVSASIHHFAWKPTSSLKAKHQRHCRSTARSSKPCWAATWRDENKSHLLLSAGPSPPTGHARLICRAPISLRSPGEVARRHGPCPWRCAGCLFSTAENVFKH